jgi:hypothetical protein
MSEDGFNSQERWNAVFNDVERAVEDYVLWIASQVTEDMTLAQVLEGLGMTKGAGGS